MVAINPGAVYGPTLTGDASGQSLKWVAAILRGKVPLFARFYFTMVDVRDVALLHVRAMTRPGAAGKRYVATSREALPFVRIAEVLAANGFAGVSTRTAPDSLIRVMGLFAASRPSWGDGDCLLDHPAPQAEFVKEAPGIHRLDGHVLPVRGPKGR